MGLRQRCQEVYQAAKKLGIKSVRALSRSTNLSKSSVHRLSQRITNQTSTLTLSPLISRVPP
jgi:O-succinylbenzoate synthase